VTILTVLLESAQSDKLLTLEIERYRHSLRKRLDRTGLRGVPAIGGFETIYRAGPKEWMLHMNLVIFGGSAKAITKFKRGFSGGVADTNLGAVQGLDDTNRHEPTQNLSTPARRQSEVSFPKSRRMNSRADNVPTSLSVQTF